MLPTKPFRLKTTFTVIEAIFVQLQNQFKFISFTIRKLRKGHKPVFRQFFVSYEVSYIRPNSMKFIKNFSKENFP